MVRSRKSRLVAADKARRLAQDDLYLTLWAERKVAEENEAIFRDFETENLLTQGSGLPVPQNLKPFFTEDEVEFRPKAPDPEKRPFDHLRTAFAILITRVVKTKPFRPRLPNDKAPTQSNAPSESDTPSKLVNAWRLLLALGYPIGARSRAGDGYRFEQALAPYYKDEHVPEAKEKMGEPQWPGLAEVFTNMTIRRSYYPWHADMGAIRQNFEDIREALHGNFWVDLGSHNAKKLRLIREIGKEYEKNTGKPFEPLMNVINDITPLDPAYRELQAAGISPEKIMKLPGDFESRQFWKDVNAAYQKVCDTAKAEGGEVPKLVITEFGGTAANRGPDGLKRQLRAMRQELHCAYTTLMSVDGTGTDLKPEDVADPDSKDLHGKTARQIKALELLGYRRLKRAYDIPETKHFHHMNVYNILHLSRMVDDPCDLTVQIHFHRPRPDEPNIAAVEFGATNHGRKEKRIYLPGERGFRTSVLEDNFEILSEQLTKLGRAYTKDLFKESGAEIVNRLGYLPEKKYKGVNHGLYEASYPNLATTPQPSPAVQFSALTCPG